MITTWTTVLTVRIHSLCNINLSVLDSFSFFSLVIASRMASSCAFNVSLNLSCSACTKQHLRILRPYVLCLTSILRISCLSLPVRLALVTKFWFWPHSNGLRPNLDILVSVLASRPRLRPECLNWVWGHCYVAETKILSPRPRPVWLAGLDIWFLRCFRLSKMQHLVKSGTL